MYHWHPLKFEKVIKNNTFTVVSSFGNLYNIFFFIFQDKQMMMNIHFIVQLEKKPSTRGKEGKKNKNEICFGLAIN